MRALCLLCAITLAGCYSGYDRATTVSVVPTAETTAVGTRDDAADDPAIWINEQNHSGSLIIGTDKNRGLELYNLAGERIQALPAGHLNNVDLVKDFDVNGRPIVLVAASDRSRDALALFRLDTEEPGLTALNRFPVEFAETYGLCFYQPGDGRTYVFMGDKSGHVNQWRLDGTSGDIQAELVRKIAFESQTEGCTVDHARGILYVGEEARGVWRLGAEPDASDTRILVDGTGGNGHLTADVEGVDLYRDGDGGYLVVSSQGDNSYAVYSRVDDNEYLGSFQISSKADSPDEVSETDGLAIAANLHTDEFPRGLLVVQDGLNTDPKATQNFKLVSWADIARALELEP